MRHRMVEWGKAIAGDMKRELYKMDTVILNNGVEMPLLGIRTRNMAEDDCEEAVTAALELGYRLIDTAQNEGLEAAVGRAIRRSSVSRKDVFLTTKLTVENTTYERTKASLKESLAAMGVDYVDLMLLPHPYNDVYGAWRAMNELKAEGLVQAVGVGNFFPDRLADLILHNKEHPQVVQIERHPYFQRAMLMNILRQQDIQPMAWAPFGDWSMLERPRVQEIAKSHGVTPEQVLIRWQIEREVAVLVRTTDVALMKDAMACFDFSLDTEDLFPIDCMEQDKSMFEDVFKSMNWLEQLSKM